MTTKRQVREQMRVARGGVEPPTFRFSVGSFAQSDPVWVPFVRSTCNT